MYKYAANTWEGQAERSGVYARQAVCEKAAAKNLAENKQDYIEIIETHCGDYKLIAHEFTTQGYENSFDIIGQAFPTKKVLIANIPEWVMNGYEHDF